jgi:(p)ppGpp synthase/HD superfamily hydrolase
MQPSEAIAIESAIALATRFHNQQRDSDGDPYILHLLRVMLACKSPLAKQAGVLHDLLEDTSATTQDILDAGLSQTLVDTLRLLTHSKDLSYAQYVLNLSQDPVATEVKMADLQDNYRIDRVKYRSDCSNHDALRLQRYILSHRFLRNEIDSEDYTQAMCNLE